MTDQKPPQFMPMTASDGEKTAQTTGLEFPCNIQKPRPKVLIPGQGDGSTDQLGKLLVTCVVNPASGGTILVQATHADGTTLGLFFDPDTLGALRHCLQLAETQLVSLEMLAKSPKPN